jgi:hypothetical protein
VRRTPKRARRGSLLFPLIVIALGVVLLLTNLGVVSTDIWRELVRFWPILLIALGIDVLVGRPSFGSALSMLITACVILSLGLAALYLFGPEAWVTNRQTFAHPRGSATAARVDLSCRGCSIAIEGPSHPENLIEGTVSVRRDERLDQLTRRTGETAVFELESHPLVPFLSSVIRSERPWRIRLHPTIPIELSVTTDGAIDLDLRDLRIESTDVSAGREPCEIVLPEAGRTTVHLFGREVVVRVPNGVGVRIVGTVGGDLTTFEDYVQIDGGLQSPNYDTSDAKVDLHLRPGVEDLDIVPLEAAPPGELQAAPVRRRVAAAWPLGPFGLS